VLVAGGNGPAGTTACELYNPLSQTWSYTGSLNTARFYHATVLLSNGQVLVTSGNPSTTTCELYDPVAKTWTYTNSLNTARVSHSATLLNNGSVLVAGTVANCELRDATTGVWSITGSLVTGEREEHSALLLGNGNVLLAGGFDTSTNMALASCEIYDVNAGLWIPTASLSTGRWGGAFMPHFNNIIASGGGSDLNTPLATCELLSSSSWSATASLFNARLKHTSTLLNNGLILVTGGRSSAGPILASCELFDQSTPPTIAAAGSPTVILEGQTVSFTSAVTNPDSDALSYLWNFGDGTTSTDPNPAHAYPTAGVYTASVAISGNSLIGAPFSITSNIVTIYVFHNSDRPTARFVSSDLNGFVGLPVGFDASFSTDPKNNIVSYDWDFGDGSPHGSTQIISRAYTAEGTYTVTLTITDGDGLTDTTSLTMVVLPASQAGLVNSNIKYSVSWNRGATNADMLSLTAAVNVGTTPVSQSSPLSLNVVGQTFTGTSATRLSMPLVAKSGPQVKWQIKPNTKKGAPKGSYALKCSIKHASLGQAFALAGVTGTKSTTAKIPIRLGIGGSNFESSINSQFRFGSSGAKASGGGSGPK
jgi:PKD repeat protein